MASSSRSLAWEIPWTEKPGGLQSMGLQRAGHDLATEQIHARVTIGIGTTGMGFCSGKEMGLNSEYSSGKWEFRASPVAKAVKNLPLMQETWVQSLGWEDPLEKKMASYSSTIAWKIPWTEEHGWLQSMESQRVGHD